MLYCILIFSCIKKIIINKCRCESKNHHLREKDYIWNPSTCSCENGKYLASIIGDSVITCDEVIEGGTKAVTTNVDKKKQSVKQKISIFYLSFY